MSAVSIEFSSLFNCFLSSNHSYINVFQIFLETRSVLEFDSFTTISNGVSKWWTEGEHGLTQRQVSFFIIDTLTLILMSYELVLFRSRSIIAMAIIKIFENNSGDTREKALEALLDDQNLLLYSSITRFATSPKHDFSDVTSRATNVVAKDALSSALTTFMSRPDGKVTFFYCRLWCLTVMVATPNSQMDNMLMYNLFPFPFFSNSPSRRFGLHRLF